MHNRLWELRNDLTVMLVQVRDGLINNYSGIYPLVVQTRDLVQNAINSFNDARKKMEDIDEIREVYKLMDEVHKDIVELSTDENNAIRKDISATISILGNLSKRLRVLTRDLMPDGAEAERPIRKRKGE